MKTCQNSFGVFKFIIYFNKKFNPLAFWNRNFAHENLIVVHIAHLGANFITDVFEKLECLFNRLSRKCQKNLSLEFFSLFISKLHAKCWTVTNMTELVVNLTCHDVLIKPAFADRLEHFTHVMDDIGHSVRNE